VSWVEPLIGITSETSNVLGGVDLLQTDFVLGLDFFDGVESGEADCECVVDLDPVDQFGNDLVDDLGVLEPLGMFALQV